MKVALVYDRVNKWGGAERVLLALHELFPEAPLFTSVYNSYKAQWASVFSIKTSFLQNFPFAKEAHELYPLLMPAAFEAFNFDEYDLVISVTSEAAKGIITKPSTLHICYCLTPTRYLWSGYQDYIPNPILRFLSKPAIAYLKRWDKVAATRPDMFIAISTEVKNRIKKYYGVDASVIHPPVGLFESESIGSNSKKGEYYLVVSRLVAYKRIDLAIKACNRLGVPLKIVGEGNQLEYLKKLAGPTIEFLGGVSDEELIPLYQNCKAFLFPGFEDFGIVMVEALGFGKPVIAYNRGGAQDIIIQHKTGILFDSQTITSLVEAVEQSMKFSFRPHVLRSQAEKFAKEKFKAEFNQFVQKTLQNGEIAL